MRWSPRRGSLRSPERPTVAEAARFACGIAILVALNLLGNWIVRVTGAPVPGSIVGMVILTALLETGVIPVQAVRSASDLLVRHLALLYVPAGVALLVHASQIRHDVIAITVAALASLVTVLVVVGTVVQRFGRDA